MILTKPSNNMIGFIIKERGISFIPLQLLFVAEGGERLTNRATGRDECINVGTQVEVLPAHLDFPYHSLFFFFSECGFCDVEELAEFRFRVVLWFFFCRLFLFFLFLPRF